MAKKIKTLQDLADISGTAAAELGLKKAIEKNQPKPSTNFDNNKSTKSKPKTIKTRKNVTTAIDEVDRIVDRMPSYEELFPINFDELRTEPYTLQYHHKKMTRDEMIKKIEEAPKRSAEFEKIYQERVSNGDNSRGYRIVSINLLREAAALKQYLKVLEKKAENS